jgi:hypothetical protein
MLTGASEFFDERQQATDARCLMSWSPSDDLPLVEGERIDADCPLCECAITLTAGDERKLECPDCRSTLTHDGQGHLTGRNSAVEAYAARMAKTVELHGKQLISTARKDGAPLAYLAGVQRLCWDAVSLIQGKQVTPPRWELAMARLRELLRDDDNPIRARVAGAGR